MMSATYLYTGLFLVLGALAALGGAEPGKPGFFGEVVRLVLLSWPTLRSASFESWGSPLRAQPAFWRAISASLRRLVTRDAGLFFRQNFQQAGPRPARPEVALLLLAGPSYHHEVFLIEANIPAGEARLMATRLNTRLDAAIGQIIPAVDVKAVEVEGLFAHAAGADLFAAFLSASPALLCPDGRGPQQDETA